MSAAIVDFLLARIAEDEAVANRCARLAPIKEPKDWMWQQSDRNPLLVEVVQPWGVSTPLAQVHSFASQAAHIARWQPVRVLAECEAKRRIVQRAQFAAEAGQSARTTGVEDAIDLTLDSVMELLALPYADHPDYREEWRP
jgi:hypothetical protein